MTDAVANAEEKPVKSRKKPLILAIILAATGAGGGFFAVLEGLIPFAETPQEATDMNSAGSSVSAGAEAENNSISRDPAPIGETAFVEIDPITVSLVENQLARHLRFRAQLEVTAKYEREVTQVLPRVMDVLNSYLRALELKDFTGPLALVRLRAQMLRRVQVVVGRDRVRDLLVMEFVLN